MSTLFDAHNHKYTKIAVAEASKASNSVRVDRQVCVICGWDPTDNVYRCVQSGCGKMLSQLEADGRENKCSSHRVTPTKKVDTY